MTALLRCWLGALLLAGLAACAVTPTSSPGAAMDLRLSPASLGRELALQQRMTVTVGGASRQLDVLIEADAQAVRLAVMDFGQVVARLEWDGLALTETRAPGWPPGITAARVLADLQLVHWPVAAIAAALPPGWRIDEQTGVRVLHHGARAMVRVQSPAPGVAELDNLAAGYRVRLEPLRPAAAR